MIGNRRPSHREGYFYKREYRYAPGQNVYRCPNGQVLNFRTTTRHGYREYASDATQCQECFVRGQCTQSRNMVKVMGQCLLSAACQNMKKMALLLARRAVALLGRILGYQAHLSALAWLLAQFPRIAPQSRDTPSWFDASGDRQKRLNPRKIGGSSKV